MGYSKIIAGLDSDEKTTGTAYGITVTGVTATVEGNKTWNKSKLTFKIEPTSTGNGTVNFYNRSTGALIGSKPFTVSGAPVVTNASYDFKSGVDYITLKANAIIYVTIRSAESGYCGWDYDGAIGGNTGLKPIINGSTKSGFVFYKASGDRYDGPFNEPRISIAGTMFKTLASAAAGTAMSENGITYTIVSTSNNSANNETTCKVKITNNNSTDVLFVMIYGQRGINADDGGAQHADMGATKTGGKWDAGYIAREPSTYDGLITISTS